ncbi:MAG: cobalamin-dependent protein [Candidatus Jordarchaeum sp.]|uniref:cobalamin-dependent protein n=1 Tax=Candidatus Jordarchaeum sp. TaxID=2823881 RepID=UPI00404951B7
MTSFEIFEKLKKAVIDYDEKEAIETATKIVEQKMDIIAAIETLGEGMLEIAKKYENSEIFLPELLLSSDTMYTALNILEPHIKIIKKYIKKRIVIGTIEGDVHDIGKNILKTMLTAAGFDIIDLGRDVPIDKFVSEVEKQGADAVAMSTLMTATMVNMERVASMLYEKGLAPRVKIAVGGAPVSGEFADDVGAHIYATNAMDAVELFKRLLR